MIKNASSFSVGVAITLVVTVLGGGMYIGALANEVGRLTQDRQEQQEDHDNITTLKADVATMKEDMRTTKETLGSMALILARIEQKVQN